MQLPTVIVLIALVSVCLAAYRRCPENPRERAKECGQVFAKFGKASLDEQKTMCRAVYKSVNCLVDLMKKCREFKFAGDPSAFSARMYGNLLSVCPPKGLDNNSIILLANTDCSSVQTECVRLSDIYLEVRERGERQLCGYNKPLVECSLFYAEKCLRKKEEVYLTQFAPFIRSYIRYCGHGDHGSSNDISSSANSVSSDVSENTQSKCSMTAYQQMINQCSDISLNRYQGNKGNICKYITSKNNCVLNVFDQCRNIVRQNTDIITQYRESLGQYNQKCLRGQIPHPHVFIDTDTKTIPTPITPINHAKCKIMAKTCADLSAKGNVKLCSIMKEAFHCMDNFVENCRWMISTEAINQIAFSRTDYLNQCIGNWDNNTMNDASYPDSTPTVEDIWQYRNSPNSKLTNIECKHLVKLCSDMIVDIYEPGERPCRKNERIRQCLMSTIKVCLFIMPPELIGILRRTSEGYETCKEDPCPNPDKDFEHCEDIMNGVKEDGLCKMGNLTLQCYKTYMARCHKKMTGFMKGGVTSFNNIMIKRCGIHMYSIHGEPGELPSEYQKYK